MNPVEFKKRLKRFLNEQMTVTRKDMHRLRREVAFEFFLERVARSKEPLVIKGAFLLEMRAEMARGRSTKDLDFVMRRRSNRAATEKDVQAGEIRLAIEKVCMQPGDDPLSFHILEEKKELGVGRDWVTGLKFFIEAKLLGKNFERFEVDVAIGDATKDPTDRVPGGKLMRGMGFNFSLIESVTSEQHFGEKLHAYTLPRDEGENSRTKDLVDLNFLISKGLDEKTLGPTCAYIFAHRASHSLKELQLPRPPESWEKKWPKLAAEIGLELSLEEGFLLLLRFFEGARLGKDF